jgi:hypothetical protein
MSVFGPTDKAAKEHREKLLSEGEPISAWRDRARFAKALLNIAARLHEGELGSDEDWETLHFDEAGFLGWNHAEKRKDKNFSDIDFEKSLIVDGVNTYWLGSGGVQPRIYWKASRPTITFECPKPYGKLFANLAIQLMMAISQLDSLAICSACGQSYKPKRRPKKISETIVQIAKKRSLGAMPLPIIAAAKAQQASCQAYFDSDLRASNRARSSADF